MKRLKVVKTEILVNSVGCRVCRPPYLDKLKAAAEATKEDLCQDCQRKVDLNPLRIFDCKVESCRDIAKGFPKITEHLCQECQEHFKAFCGYLDLYGITYEVEPRLVRGLDYYTKTVFEVCAQGIGSQNAVCGGGRYDKLAELLGGQPTPAVGFASGIERIVLILQHQKCEIPDVGKHFDASIFGIDVIFEKGIEYGFRNQKCIFLELNSRPYLKMHHFPRFGPRQNLNIYYKKLDQLKVADSGVF